MFLLEIDNMEACLRRVHYDDDDDSRKACIQAAKIENRLSDTVKVYPVEDFVADIAYGMYRKNKAMGIRTLVDAAIVDSGEDQESMRNAISDVVGSVTAMPLGVSLGENEVNRILDTFCRRRKREENEAYKDNQ